MTNKTEKDTLSRRKMLTRIGLLAATSYTVPALTTLSMAQAGSGASSSTGGGGGSSSASVPSAPSAPSSASTPSVGSDDTGGTGGGGGTTGTDPAVIEATCGPENLDDPNYLQCLIDNGFDTGM